MVSYMEIYNAINTCNGAQAKEWWNDRLMVYISALDNKKHFILHFGIFANMQGWFGCGLQQYLVLSMHDDEPISKINLLSSVWYIICIFLKSWTKDMQFTSLGFVLQ